MLSNGMRYRVRFDCSGLFCWQAFCIGKRLCRAQRHARRHTGVTLRCERPKAEEQQEERNDLRREFYYGAFSRTVPLPVGVQGEKATAQLKDGILEIRIPKSAEARVKEIPVSVSMTWQPRRVCRGVARDRGLRHPLRAVYKGGSVPRLPLASIPEQQGSKAFQVDCVLFLLLMGLVLFQIFFSAELKQVYRAMVR